MDDLRKTLEHCLKLIDEAGFSRTGIHLCAAIEYLELERAGTTFLPLAHGRPAAAHPLDEAQHPV